MLRFVRGVVVAELLILWVELFYKLGVVWKPGALVVAIPFYFVYLVLLHAAFRAVERVTGFRVLAVVIGGMAGLAVEWLMVGNAPWQRPEVLQSAQFLFHGAYPVLGYLFVRAPATVWRTRLAVYMTLATVIAALGGLIGAPDLRKLWFLFVPIIAYAGLYVFIFRLPVGQRARIYDGR